MELSKPNKDSIVSPTPGDEITLQDIAEQKEINTINSIEEKEVKIATEKEEMKEFQTNMLIITCYWLEIISKLSFYFSLVFYEYFAMIAITDLSDVLDGELQSIINTITFWFKYQFKTRFVFNISQHLAIGFFCLINFSKVLKETNRPFRFIIKNLIKAFLFYFLSLFILIFIQEAIFESIRKKIGDVPGNHDKMKTLIDDLEKKSIRYLGNLLGNFNNGLDKLLIGSIYIFLFHSPEYFKEKKIIYFRLFSILPILYILVGLILRILNNLDVITLDPRLSQLLIGPKVTIFGFFTSILIYIKLKGKKYRLFDEENNLIPIVFAKISSRIFSIFGIVEFISGFFFSSFSDYGIGNHYLLILCAPIMTLYDYQKEKEIHISCVKRNIAEFISYLISFLFAIAIGLGIFIFSLTQSLLPEKIEPLVEIINNNFELIIEVLDLIL